VVRATRLFTHEQRQTINRAVADAENRTAAEILPVVVGASGRYDRAEDIFGVVVAIIAFILTWVLFQGEDPSAGGWEGPAIAVGWPTLAGVFVGGFIVGAVVASRIWTIRRWFTSREHMKDAVADKARAVFFDQSIHHTKAAGGVLVFVSLYEKLALVLADREALDALGEVGLNRLRDDLVSRLKRGDLTNAIAAVIHEAGDLLADGLPQTERDRNELPDALVLID